MEEESLLEKWGTLSEGQKVSAFSELYAQRDAKSPHHAMYKFLGADEKLFKGVEDESNTYFWERRLNMRLSKGDIEMLEDFFIGGDILDSVEAADRLVDLHNRKILADFDLRQDLYEYLTNVMLLVNSANSLRAEYEAKKSLYERGDLNGVQ